MLSILHLVSNLYSMSPVNQETMIIERTSSVSFIEKSEIPESLRAVMIGKNAFIRSNILPSTLKVAVFNQDYSHGLAGADKIVPPNVEMYVHETITDIVSERDYKTYTVREGETNQQVLDRIYAEVLGQASDSSLDVPIDIPSPQEVPSPTESKPNACQYHEQYVDLISRSALAFAAKRAPEVLAEIKADVDDGCLILLKAYDVCDRYLGGTNVEKVIQAFGQYFPREDIVVIPHPIHTTRYKISLQVASSQ